MIEVYFQLVWNEYMKQTTGFSWAKVFDDDVPDDAPADDADAFPIDDVIDWKEYNLSYENLFNMLFFLAFANSLRYSKAKYSNSIFSLAKTKFVGLDTINKLLLLLGM